MTKTPTCFISGVDGQDGSYMAELLLSKGYIVHGLIRRSVNNPANIADIRHKLILHYGDLETENHISRIIADVQPDLIFNLAGQSDVMASFEIPEYTGNITGLGVTRVLEAVRHFSPNSGLYQASSSEMFGGFPPPQDERHGHEGQKPVCGAKIYAHNMIRNYRESYGLFCCSGICFNHESQRRPVAFVTRKITNAVARIKLGKQHKLELGNLEGSRDWGYAPDYVKGMLMMLERDKPDDFVLGTGIGHTVRDFAKAAFECVGLNYERYVEINPRYVRPSETYPLLANPAKANTVLGWKAETTFEQLVKKMVDYDLKLEGGK